MRAARRPQPGVPGVNLPSALPMEHWHDGGPGDPHAILHLHVDFPDHDSA